MSDPRADLVALLAEVVDDPAAFARLVLHVDLRGWQSRVFEEIRVKLAKGEQHIRVLVRSAHGAGKTTLAVILSLWWTATRPQSRGITTAPTWNAVESVFWVELARLFNGSLLARAGVGRLLTTELVFAPSWDLCGLSTDHSVNLEGRHSPTAACRIVDEAKAVEADVIESTEALLDAPSTLDCWISTPSTPTGSFYMRDVKGGPDIIRCVVTIDDLVAEGLPGKAEWRAARLKEWGLNSPIYESRALARYVSDSEGSLYPFAWVERAMAADFDVTAAPVGGLDVGGSTSGDETALALMAADDLGRVHVHSVVGWHSRDTQVSKGKAIMLCREAGASVLAVDYVGLGKGLGDSIRTDFPGVVEFRASDKPQDPLRFANAKAETAWKLRELLEHGVIALPDSPTLKSQLLSMKYAITITGKIRVVDPTDSPDHVDAVLIGLYAALGSGPPASMDQVSFGKSDSGSWENASAWGAPPSGRGPDPWA